MIRARSRIPYWEEPFRLRNLPSNDNLDRHRMRLSKGFSGQNFELNDA
jgi:hypothetical protein